MYARAARRRRLEGEKKGTEEKGVSRKVCEEGVCMKGLSDKETSFLPDLLDEANIIVCIHWIEYSNNRSPIIGDLGLLVLLQIGLVVFSAKRHIEKTGE